ncbi:hypothetical protein BH20ACT15_BH20ACT15_03120 [soil metagenome]
MTRAALRLGTALLLAGALVSLVPAGASAAPFGSRTLKVGSKGKDVRVLQRSLTTLGRKTSVNGFYGKPTKRSVKKLERKKRWKVDGKVNRKDAKRIKKLVAKRGKTSSLFFLGGITQPSVTITANRAGSATVNVIDENNGLGVVSLPVTFTSAGSQTVSWNGATAVTGLWAPDSEYRFKLSGGSNINASMTGQTKPFSLRRHFFPVPGPHSFGGAGSRFGAGRSGHTHQGQDVSAKCGEKLYAAEAGTVTTKAYQGSGAGYYIVITGAYTGTSHVYFHMLKPSWASEGTKVYPGQQVGKVGNTGRSFGCHLHFERWSAPGWYQGGSPYDPLAELQAWDAYS